MGQSPGNSSIELAVFLVLRGETLLSSTSFELNPLRVGSLDAGR